jgi:hypothetical protein
VTRSGERGEAVGDLDPCLGEFALGGRELIRSLAQHTPGVGHAEKCVDPLEEAAQRTRIRTPRREEGLVAGTVVERNDVEQRGQLRVLKLVHQSYGEVSGAVGQVQTDDAHRLPGRGAVSGICRLLAQGHQRVQPLHQFGCPGGGQIRQDQPGFRQPAAPDVEFAEREPIGRGNVVCVPIRVEVLDENRQLGSARDRQPPALLPVRAADALLHTVDPQAALVDCQEHPVAISRGPNPAEAREIEPPLPAESAYLGV